MFEQLITPNPYIPCKPGWCLAYVNEAFRVPKRFPTAISSWHNSKSQHIGFNFPQNVWVPLWFSLKNEPAGHVVLRAPNGKIYSTSHPTSTTITIHPNLEDLFRVYSVNNPLTYLGWTEDVEGTPVIAIATPEDEMRTEDFENLLKVATDARNEATNSKNNTNELVKIATDARNEATNAKVNTLAIIETLANLSPALGKEIADNIAKLGAKELAKNLKIVAGE